MDTIQLINKAEKDNRVNITVVVRHEQGIIDVHTYSNTPKTAVVDIMELKSHLQSRFPHKVHHRTIPFASQEGQPVYGIKTPNYLVL